MEPREKVWPFFQVANMEPREKILAIFFKVLQLPPSHFIPFMKCSNYSELEKKLVKRRTLIENQ